MSCAKLRESPEVPPRRCIVGCARRQLVRGPRKLRACVELVGRDRYLIYLSNLIYMATIIIYLYLS